MKACGNGAAFRRRTMDRLTFEGNFCDIAMCREITGGSFCEDGYCSQRKVWERLKAYEDTGLEPEDVMKLSEMIEKLRKEVNHE
jgi:hypothetical protein